MDIIDILGGMLNRKASGSGKGPDILRDILKGGKREETQRPASPQTSPLSDADLKKAARETEETLRGARDRNSDRRAGQAQQTFPAPERRPAETSRPVDNPFGNAGGGTISLPNAGHPTPDEEALVLVQAMLNAAKADGQISPDEQQKMLEQFGDQPDAMQFLKDELRKPLDVREFAWSVPLGMEQKVYALSLMAITADSRAEAEYLNELAHGLRLSAEAREQLQRRYATRR